jgi:hypothetical protein
MTQQSSRRGFFKKVTYVAPLILTLKVTPANASNGSSCGGSRGQGHSRGRGRGHHSHGRGHGYGHSGGRGHGQSGS